MECICDINIGSQDPEYLSHLQEHCYAMWVKVCKGGDSWWVGCVGVRRVGGGEGSGGEWMVVKEVV